jgi:hypothetical protein
MALRYWKRLCMSTTHFVLYILVTYKTDGNRLSISVPFVTRAWVRPLAELLKVEKAVEADSLKKSGPPTKDWVIKCKLRSLDTILVV